MYFKTGSKDTRILLNEKYFFGFKAVSALTLGFWAIFTGMEQWFSNLLHTWYNQNKRDLPWRNTREPYKIWLSEIILQQTQVIQGLAYYNRFLEAFPTVSSLAKAEEEQVLKLWQGLGYYARARNLHKAAKMIVYDYKGKFPANYNDLLRLPGVGEYTAAAIASFAYKQHHAVVDGNVYRFLSRLFGISEPIDGTQGKRIFSELAQDLLDSKRPDIHNQAIMEFGSRFCKVQSPTCPSCVFNSRCEAFKAAIVADLPVKSKKTKVRQRFFNYLIMFNQKNQFILEKRGEGDIWQGLYEFYNIETEAIIEFPKLKIHEKFKALNARNITVLHQSKWYKHQLSHQLLNARFYLINADYEAPKGLKKSNVNDIQTMPLPRLISKYLEDGHLKK